MAGIEVFTPSVRQIVIDGTAIAIGPFKARQFSAVQKAMRPIAAVIEASPDKLIADNMADLVDLLAAATGQSAEWLFDRDPDQLLDLLGEVLSVNADFSRSRVRPAFDRLAAKIAVLAGEPSSPLSGDADTDVKPS